MLKILKHKQSCRKYLSAKGKVDQSGRRMVVSCESLGDESGYIPDLPVSDLPWKRRFRVGGTCKLFL